MGKPRIELQTLLLTFVPNVYFQPPNALQMKYPCIIYELDSMDTVFADNRPHFVNKRYTVTVIDSNPDSDIPNKVALLPLCIFNRFFVADNLNHFVHTLYF